MYKFNSRVRYSEVDEDQKLTVTGIINYLQDCSTFQSEDLGLGIEYLARNHRAWWLSSWQIVIDRYPVYGEEVVIGTWPYDFRGIYGYRNFTIQDQAGNYLVRANSVWFFFDTLAGRPVRVSEEDVRGYGTGEEGKLEMEYAPRRIAVPGNFKAAEVIPVGRQHLDTNHHVNNAQYVEIAREVVPAAFNIAELRVEYKTAAVLGDMIYPRVSQVEEGYVVMLGNAAGEPYAVVYLKGSRNEIIKKQERL